MATQVKIKGLERGKSVVADGSVTGGSYRGFRVPVTFLGQSYTGGSSVKAFLDIGATTNKWTATSKIGGAAGNNINIVVTSSGGGAAVLSVVTTFTATTGYPTITVTAGSATTPQTIVAAVNADPTASQYVTASALSTAIGTTLAAVTTTPLATGANGTGTAEAFYARADNKSIVIVDVDDPKTQRILKRNVGRYISLGAA